MSEAGQLHGGVGRADGDQDDDGNPVVEVPPVEGRRAHELWLRGQTQQAEVDPGQHRRRGDERDEHHPVDEEIAEHRAAERPDVGREEPCSRIEKLDDAAQSRDWFGLDVPRQLLGWVGLTAFVRVLPPRTEPSANVAAAGDR